MIDYCATTTVLNGKDLFTSNFRRVAGIGITTVSGEDYYPTHIDTVELLWKDNKGGHLSHDNCRCLVLPVVAGQCGQCGETEPAVCDRVSTGD